MSILRSVNDVVIGKHFYNRFDTEGILPVFDQVIGQDMPTKDGKIVKGGIVPGGIYMINGAAGCGKSTAMMTIADALGQCDHKIAYITSEESEEKLAFDCVERLDLTHFMVGACQDFDSILNAFEESNIKVGFIDSIADVTIPRKTLRAAGKRRDEYLCERLKAFKSKGITLFLINHLTKAGDYKGSSKILHSIDVMMWLVHADADYYSSDMREFYCTKNRYGPTNVRAVIPFSLEGYNFEENYYQEIEEQPQVNKHEQKRRARIESLKTYFQEGNDHFTMDDHEEFGMKRAAFSAFIKDMEEREIVGRDGKDGRKVKYVLSIPLDSEEVEEQLDFEDMCESIVASIPKDAS